MKDIILPILTALFGSGFLVTLISALASRSKRVKEQVNSLKLGMQALLRDRLLHCYRKYTEQGSIPIYARENFENMYKQYHSLGANGVMDRFREELMELPTSDDCACNEVKK